MKVTIKQAAEAKGLSLYKLSKLTLVAEQTIYSWASGRTQPSYENIDFLCEVLDCEVADLFTAEKEAGVIAKTKSKERHVENLRKQLEDVTP